MSRILHGTNDGEFVWAFRFLRSGLAFYLTVRIVLFDVAT
jgi:hypothetical protein